jgi:Na+/proline symporter
VLVGIAFGILAVLIVSSFFPPDPQLGPALVAGYFMVWGVVVGLAGGLTVWLVVDSRSKKAAKEVTVETRQETDSEQA